MKIIHDFNIQKQKETVITIGNFDGVHLGHKKLINMVKEISVRENLTSIVFSFNPHPFEVFNKDKDFFYILTQEEKTMEIDNLGIDIFLNYPFTFEFSKITFYEFIKILKHKLNCRVLIVGDDYCFGKNRRGNVATLIEIGKDFEMDIIKVPNIKLYGDRVSSSEIRKYLTEKNIQKANALLGKHYYISGEVVEGNKLGRTIGFPTANIIPTEEKLLLPDGVYITQTQYKGRIYKSITNIGKNPTVNNSLRTVETFIFDFNEDLYGEHLKVMFLEWIRDGRKFSGIDELKVQISKDTGIAEKYFEKNSNNY